MEDLPSCKDEDILERVDDIVAIFQHECAKRAGVPRDQRAKPSESTEVVLTTNGHLVSKYSQRLQLFTVFSDVSIADATLADVVELLQEPDDGFLRRIFSDQDMVQLHTLAAIGATGTYEAGIEHDQRHLHVPPACTLKKVLFREKGIFLTHPKEILLVDHVQPMTPTSILWVFKSIDNGNYPTTSRDHIVPRHTHIMGGYLMELISPTAVRPAGVRVTYYAEHAVYPKQFASSLDTRLRLEKFGHCIVSWPQMLHQHRRRRSTPPDNRLLAVQPPVEPGIVDATCRSCAKGFHWFRRACTCSVCGGSICVDCSALENVTSPTGLHFNVPVCFVCLVQIKTNNGQTNADDASAAMPRSVGSTFASYSDPNRPSATGLAPLLDDVDDDDDGWSESSMGLPPLRKSTLRPSMCQSCAIQQSVAQCAVCGMYFCGKCADTDLANVVCRTCKPPANRPPAPVLLLPPQALPPPVTLPSQLDVQPHGAPPFQSSPRLPTLLSPLSSLPSPPPTPRTECNDTTHGIPPPPRISTLSDEMHIRLRDTYASTVQSSSAALHDVSLSSTDDLMPMPSTRRSAPTNPPFSDDGDDLHQQLPHDVVFPIQIHEDARQQRLGGPGDTAKPTAPSDDDTTSGGTPATASTSPSALSSPCALHDVTPAEVEAACLDISSNAAYDALCEDAIVAMECSNAYVVLLYKDQFMLKGAAGTGYVPVSIPVSCAFCMHTVAACADPLIVPDATVDARFQNSVRVVGKESIRFYYGVVVQAGNGHVIGTVCALDTSPRMRIGRHQKHAMEEFARRVAALVHGIKR
ncbi:hypothetical protein DYB32_003717 [Aphanomyces invadans]|uniref:GAF domain-containing protein n=1 Tax=Aphanomyces invadans TaxID=157072 RepID=A0A3R6Z0P0_9STRA|nr:hypothetical protein DYB32_003717 [Aphanomyces invadans]